MTEKPYKIRQDTITGHWLVTGPNGLVALGPIVEKRDAEEAAARLNAVAA